MVSQNNQFPTLVILDLVGPFSNLGNPLADAGASGLIAELIDSEDLLTSLSAMVGFPWVVQAWCARRLAISLGFEGSDPVFIVDFL